jgi:ribosome-binding ATPase YchF (GTP1/OBG family)
MKVGIFGKTNVGKSTLFKALTLEDVEIADRPFTTIEPNVGIGYVTVPCPEKEFGVKCNPGNAPCKNGTRFVPVEIVDVAGLIRGASEGKGLGNKFLSDAMAADVLIEVVDGSGKTDENGNPTEYRNPVDDILMVEDELLRWLSSIILRTRIRGNQKLEEALYQQLTGLKFTLDQVKNALNQLNISKLDENNSMQLAKFLVSNYKKIVIALNKIDIAKNYEEVKKEIERLGYPVVPCSAEIILMLREAEKNGYIQIENQEIKVVKPLSPQQASAIKLGEKFLKEHGDCAQQLINKTVLEIYGGKVIFPVEDENKLTDSRGRILPDAFILPADATPLDLAQKIHSEIAQNLKLAIDCKTKMKIGKNDKLKHLQVVKLVT